MRTFWQRSNPGWSVFQPEPVSATYQINLRRTGFDMGQHTQWPMINSNSLNCSQCSEALITWDDIVPSPKQGPSFEVGLQWMSTAQCRDAFLIAPTAHYHVQLQLLQSKTSRFHAPRRVQLTTSNSPFFSRPGESHVERSQSHKLQGQRWREWRYHPQRTRSGRTDSNISNMKATNGSRKSSQKVSNLCWFHFPFRYWTWCWFYLPMRWLGYQLDPSLYHSQFRPYVIVAFVPNH